MALVGFLPIHRFSAPRHPIRFPLSSPRSGRRNGGICGRCPVPLLTPCIPLSTMASFIVFNVYSRRPPSLPSSLGTAHPQFELQQHSHLASLPLRHTPSRFPNPSYTSSRFGRTRRALVRGSDSQGTRYRKAPCHGWCKAGCCIKRTLGPSGSTSHHNTGLVDTDATY